MTKTASQRRRIALGYEQHPPRCLNCQRWEPPVHGVPGRTPYKQAWCSLGDFATGPGSICDHWLGKDGETLLPSAESPAISA